MALNTDFVIRSEHDVATLPKVVNILQEIRSADLHNMSVVFDLRGIRNSEALRSAILGALSVDFGRLLAHVSFMVDD